jgi:hypothetical protein
VYTVNASGVNTGVTMSKGNHCVVVQSWDNQGKVYKTALNITAQWLADSVLCSWV